jgi:hypothetical protein
VLDKKQKMAVRNGSVKRVVKHNSRNYTSS